MLNAESYQNYRVAAIDAPVSERMAFLKKVYGLLAVSVFTAVVASVMTLSNELFLQTVRTNYFVFIILEFAVLFFVFWARKKETMGLVALFAFTILTGITISPMVFAFKHVAIQAMTLTTLTFAGLSGYVAVTKKDFSFLSGILVTGLIVLIVGGLLNMLFFRSFDMAYLSSIFGVFLFSGFILYDTSNILRKYPTDEYISATLALYLDVLNLFQYLLFLLGGSRD